MLEIRTVIVPTSLPGKFDNEVNALIKEGWELVRRDVLPPYEGECSTVRQSLYAEFERNIDEPETDDDEDEDTETGDWDIVRDPTRPYRCSKCGYKATIKWPRCPSCNKLMRVIEE